MTDQPTQKGEMQKKWEMKEKKKLLAYKTESRRIYILCFEADNSCMRHFGCSFPILTFFIILKMSARQISVTDFSYAKRQTVKFILRDCMMKKGNVDRWLTCLSPMQWDVNGNQSKILRLPLVSSGGNLR